MSTSVKMVFVLVLFTWFSREIDCNICHWDGWMDGWMLHMCVYFYAKTYKIGPGVYTWFYDQLFCVIWVCLVASSIISQIICLNLKRFEQIIMKDYLWNLLDRIIQFLFGQVSTISDLLQFTCSNSLKFEETIWKDHNLCLVKVFQVGFVFK